MQTTTRKICTRCVMDSTDPDITFDSHGVCNHCHTYDKNVEKHIPSGKSDLNRLIREIQGSVPNTNKYNCLVGVSGGVDSSYVLYKAKELGLYPLAFHLDNEWNDPISNKNIRLLVDKLGVDLVVQTVNWPEFRDLQLAFLYASTPDSEIPTDYALNAITHQLADKHGIKYILNGCNIRTESHLPKAWSQGHFDWKYIEGIHKRFGHTPLTTYPVIDLLTAFKYATNHKVVSILNYLNYNKTEAMRVLEKEIGWEYYGGKHYESTYTRFYQGYILPKKFGFDKRKMHFSSLICSGEMTREMAFIELERSPYPIEQQESDKSYVCNKLGISSKEFERIMQLPIKKFDDYPSYTNSPHMKIARAMRNCYVKAINWRN